MVPAQWQRWCLKMMEDISQQYTEISLRFSAEHWWRRFRRISQLTMQLTWSLAITCHMGGFTTHRSSSWGWKRLTSRQTSPPYVFSSHHGRWWRQCLFKKEGWRAKTLCRLSCALQGDDAELVSPSMNLWNASPCAWGQDIHETGLPWCL